MRRPAIVALGSVLAVAIASVAFGAGDGPESGFLHGREDTWSAAVDTFLDRPFYGTGADAFLAGSARYQGGAAIVFERDEVLAAGSASGALAGGGSGERGSLALERVSLDFELDPLGDPVRLAGELTGGAELTVCRASGALRRDSQGTPIDCLAVTTQTSQEPAAETELRRSVAIVFADGGQLALMTARPPGAAGHGDEEVVAALTDGEGEVAITEALLSTQYDGAGRQRRANVELWREGEVPLRVAGTIICGATVEAASQRIETGFFRWSLDGRPGLGRYEVARRS
jgi:hypothetical protein